jgi:hypothetical protein
MALRNDRCIRLNDHPNWDGPLLDEVTTHTAGGWAVFLALRVRDRLVAPYTNKVVHGAANRLASSPVFFATRSSLLPASHR